MSKKVFAVIVISVVVSSLLFGLTNWGFADGSGPAPGSDLDPIVTKSYVDQVATALRTYVNDALKENSSSGYKIVVLSAGQKLTGENGSEIILRSGKAKAITTTSGGIVDLTKGIDIKANQKIPANHLLLIPRSDGRGLKAQTKVIIMVKGEFTVN